MTLEIAWPVGILAVVQTPFGDDGAIDADSLSRLIDDLLDANVDGLLVPAVASENAYLSLDEKLKLAMMVQAAVAGKVPVFWGAGAYDLETVVRIAIEARDNGAAGCLVAVPPSLYKNQAQIIPHFAKIAAAADIPLMVQDLQFSGPGMDVATILALCEEIAAVRYLKIETAPAGPKYSAVLAATDGKVHVSGGWAVPQMIEALDRGVHAMIPESSMVRIYKRIDGLHRAGKRDEAVELFQRLTPVLAFANQQLDVSIRFFKRLLVRKGIFTTAVCRLESPEFDRYQQRIADELIEYVLEIEEEISHTPTEM